jgi:flagellar basal-body rod modification protein FlgD
MATAVDAFSALNAAAAAAGKAAPVQTQNQAGAQDRFLKLLVAQMQNQDPLNPMDNAQVTSQMAQIQAVSGIDKLNTTVAGLGTQFAQLAAVQGASLVGHDVIVPGSLLSANDKGLVQGGYQIDTAADSVKVEILNAGGHVIDTLDLGAQGSGSHSFDWTPPSGVDPALGASFRVVAKSGATTLSSTALMRDRVDAVLAGGDTLSLELRSSGTVPYTQIRAFN